MIDHLKRVNDLNTKLSKLNNNELNGLYYRVFSTPDGEMVLHDLANRLHEYIPATNDFQEGQRSAYVSIISRLLNSVEKKEVTNGEG